MKYIPAQVAERITEDYKLGEFRFDVNHGGWWKYPYQGEYAKERKIYEPYKMTYMFRKDDVIFPYGTYYFKDNFCMMEPILDLNLPNITFEEPKDMELYSRIDGMNEAFITFRNESDNHDEKVMEGVKWVIDHRMHWAKEHILFIESLQTFPVMYGGFSDRSSVQYMLWAKKNSAEKI